MSDQALPTDSKARKDIPMMTGLLDYFPAALAYVARVSKAGNDKHNPGEPMHHARGKSSDHADCAVRHLIDRGSIDPDDKMRHTGKAAWRILAELQEELEREEGAPMARGARPAPRVFTEGELQKGPDDFPYTPRDEMDAYHLQRGLRPAESETPGARAERGERALARTQELNAQFRADGAVYETGKPPRPAPSGEVTSESLVAGMTEEEKVAEYGRLVSDGLSDHEARGTVWPEPAPTEASVMEDAAPLCRPGCGGPS